MADVNLGYAGLRGRLNILAFLLHSPRVWQATHFPRRCRQPCNESVMCITVAQINDGACIHTLGGAAVDIDSLMEWCNYGLIRIQQTAYFPLMYRSN